MRQQTDSITQQHTNIQINMQDQFRTRSLCKIQLPNKGSTMCERQFFSSNSDKCIGCRCMSWDSGQGGMSRDSGRVCERVPTRVGKQREGGAHAQLSVHSHIGATAAATACVREREGWKQQQLMEEGAPLRATPPAASDTQRQADRPHSELRDAARPEHCRLIL